MKKILIGILIGICMMISCGSSISNKSSTIEHSSIDSVFISQAIKNSNFKIVEIGNHENIKFYKVYVTSKTNNGDYIHELLITKYIGYNVIVTNLGYTK